MLNQKRLVILFCTFLLGACTVTGPADDGFESDNEWIDNGRLGSSDMQSLFKSKQKKDTVKTVHASSFDLDEKTEFEYFKIWNKLRTKGAESDEYREFLQWLNYQNFKTKQ